MGENIVWGIFLWKASREPKKHSSLISFTIYANLFHGALMFVQALIRTHETTRLLGDTLHLFLPAAALFVLRSYVERKRRR